MISRDPTLLCFCQVGNVVTWSDAAVLGGIAGKPQVYGCENTCKSGWSALDQSRGDATIKIDDCGTAFGMFQTKHSMCGADQFCRDFRPLGEECVDETVGIIKNFRFGNLVVFGGGFHPARPTAGKWFIGIIKGYANPILGHLGRQCRPGQTGANDMKSGGFE